MSGFSECFRLDRLVPTLSIIATFCFSLEGDGYAVATLPRRAIVLDCRTEASLMLLAAVVRLKQKREDLSAVETSLSTVQPEAQRLAAEEACT